LAVASLTQTHFKFQNLRTGLRYLRKISSINTIADITKFQNLRTGLRYLRKSAGGVLKAALGVSKPSNRSQVFEDDNRGAFLPT